MIYQKWVKAHHSFTAQKMKFSIKDFFSKCDQIRSPTDTEEILNGKVHFLCNDLTSC